METPISNVTLFVSLHPWCRDTARDEAVRAAEDGRQGWLPTLDEAIGMLAKSGSSTSAPEPENKGVRMTKSDRQAADYRAEASEREAPAASGGGEGEPEPPQPRGWLSDGERTAIEEGAEILYQRGSYASSNRAALLRGLLTRVTDTEPRGWLSEEEREFLDHHLRECEERAATFSKALALPWFRRMKLIESLLARSTPPEVVLGECPFTPGSTHAMGWWEAIGKVRKALAAAGVRRGRRAKNQSCPPADRL